MPILSVVIPALNEENGIETIIRRVLAVEEALAQVGVEGLELIVVDDGSTDRTAQLVATFPEVRLIRHKTNSGYGAALKSGFAAASGEWVGFLDADGTYPPEYYPALMEAALAQEADIVIGSRMAGADSQMPFVRRVGNVLFARLVSIISARTISDSASGMRVFRKALLPRLYPLPDGLNLTPVMSTRALHERLHMVEVPIPYSERIGRSKLSVVHDGMRFAQSIVWTALCYNPVRPLGLIAVLALLVATLVAAGLVVARLSGIAQVGPLGVFALFTALVSAVAGVSLLALGISFNYFVALFHKTPVRQGLFGRPVFPKLERHFGLAGVGLVVIGLGIAAGSLLFGTLGWGVERLWLYYLGSAGFTLVGIQLVIGWVQMQVLDMLRLRNNLVDEDMQGKEQLVQQPAPEGAVSTGVPRGAAL